jgi:hypothetical protein
VNEKNIDAARKAAALVLMVAKNGGAFAATKGRLLAREEMLRALECTAFDPETAAQTVDQAWSGDPDARIALHTAIAVFAATDQPIPVALRPYLFRVLDVGKVGPGKPGVNPHNNTARNQWIIAAINTVLPYGFEPTRNPATADKGGTQSGCSIVAEELASLGHYDLTESALNSIWSDRDLLD